MTSHKFLNRVARRYRNRRGATAMLFGFLLPVFIGLTALAVDVAVVALARDQLSTAADSAALAGAAKLADEYRVRGATDLTAEITAANSLSATFAQDNAVLNTAPVVVQDPQNDGSGDILVGYLDPTNPQSTLQSSAAYTQQFNAVQVTLSRNATHTGDVPTFFARLMGFTGTAVSVKSTATALNYSIAGFQAINGVTNANLLPIVLDVDTYDQMMANETTDQYSYDPTTNTVTNGPDGIYESLLYPVAAGDPGNWGTIKVGVSNNSTSILNAQIQYGITPAELATYPNSTISLDYTQTPPQIIFSGNPGISAGIKSGLNAIIGKPVIIPIYDITGGNGSNAWYRVIAFQMCRILVVNFQGNPKYVIIQPALGTDPTAIPGSVEPSWTSGGLVRVHLAR